ncbi:hypothetical protein RJ640_012356 [Escallonia rubra]|uniref:BRCT domain-containing protein n=1 Tax=Escallonia rubra TaxID=112253 RepID=A0AA88R6P1_9ASTE|nr:hypothetical protein RJ640_012356 [Escallonia rubra]
MMTRTFKGASVYMSRNLVPPELFDPLHDALKQNGARLFLCSDPSRNGPDDYHVIASRDHVIASSLRVSRSRLNLYFHSEKFEAEIATLIFVFMFCDVLYVHGLVPKTPVNSKTVDLKSQATSFEVGGGPQCVLSCAKEHRMLPKQGFTCCLAMDGVKVLASGFEMDEKVEIGKLVTAMGGVVHTKASLDVSFVIVKNVLAAKYKWALNVLKKPVVTINWLHQCWKEHRIVPQEPYRIPSFSGLTICVTKVPADVRKEMEKLVSQNGGKYSAELTRKCTHLICDISYNLLWYAAEGDKYKVAKRWGHIYLVTKKWFDQSVARRACLNEESYPVQASTASTVSGGRTSLMAKRIQDKVVESSQHAPSSVATDAKFQAVLCDRMTDADTEATLSQNMSSTFSDAPAFVKEDSGGPAMIDCDINLDACIADDSQTEDNDLYLSECRIMLVGFDASEMRKLVDMVRRGGGSRYMSFNDKLTHIVVGNPSETEKKEVRALAALGVIYVVRSIWLEECDYGKKEIPVLRRHMALDLILPKGLITI